MKFSFPKASVYSNGAMTSAGFVTGDVDNTNTIDQRDGICVRSDEYSVFPAFCDVHVHFREPGFFYKESIKTGSMAAARGGYTDVFAMPNLDPVPDDRESLALEKRLIDEGAVISVHPYAAISVGEAGERLAPLSELAPDCIAFSDDGRGVQSESLMREAMQQAKKLGKIIAAHCEDNSLLRGGYIHDGAYAAAHGHLGISSESEWSQIQRDLRLAKETGCKYHVCHISTKESVELIRRAKADGVDVSCETAPHYLVLDDSMLIDDGRFKMNPPIRAREDREALTEGLLDGTIDMIATDHAPHSAEEKSRGLKGSLMGVSGLEVAFPVVYTKLVRPGLLPLERLIELMAIAPRRRFGLPDTSDICVFDLKNPFEIDPESFLSKGHSSPFAGWQVYGRNKLTVYGGKAVWSEIV